jgi:hypothetical protein
MINTILNFLQTNCSQLHNNLSLSEPRLLSAIGFAHQLGLSKANRGVALFGYAATHTDYIHRNYPHTIIEIKFIRTTQTAKSTTHRECDIKNGLAQIIEQAYCLSNIQRAIMVIIDNGRASNRPWNTREVNYLNFFQRNPFNINLQILRIFDIQTNSLQHCIY